MDKVQNRVLQDRRRLSRISVQMECRFTSDEKEYGALMLDLSQGGALLSSTFLPTQLGIIEEERHSKKGEEFPDQQSRISITLDAVGLKGPMTLLGTIKRSSIGMSEYGKVAQFGVEFEHTPLELLRLISRLSARRKDVRVPTQIDCRYRIDDEEYEARILNLSQKGALMYSTIMPALNKSVHIIIELVNMGVPPMTLQGIITRNAVSSDGEEGQFVVEFEKTPPELDTLIRVLQAAGTR